MKKVFRGSLLCVVFMNAAATHAQAGSTTAAGPAVTGSSTTSTGNTGGIQDIIVTAQRFTESAQKAPLVIHTIKGSDLVGTANISQLQSLSPGVSIQAAGGSFQTFIRGVGTLQANNAQGSAISYNLDGVSLYNPTMLVPLMYDVDRIEVLKGPQGTLYGRNASGGAINIISKDAELGATDGYIEGEVGNYALRHIEGGINIPVSDTFAVRVAGRHIDHNGYLSDGTDDFNSDGGRIRALWQPSPGVTLRIGLDLTKDKYIGGGTSINPNPTGDKFIGGLDPRANQGDTALLVAAPYIGPFNTNGDPSISHKQFIAYGKLDVNLGFATLTVLPSYVDEHLISQTLTPGYFVREDAPTTQKAIEVRLSHQSDRIRWIVGGYYFNALIKDTNILLNPTNFQSVIAYTPTRVKSYAFFGETTFTVFDGFRLIGGLRYTHETTNIGGYQNAAVAPLFPDPQTPAFRPGIEPLDAYISEHASAGPVTWRVGAEYDLSPTSLLFATASRGFKGGGAYVDQPGADTSFRPEYLTAFELGSKNRFLSNTLQVNLEAFYWRYTDQQTAFVTFSPYSDQVVFATFNAGKSHMYGGNVDVLWRPSPADTLHVGIEYVKSDYDEFTRLEPAFAYIPGGCPATSAGLSAGGIPQVSVDCAGQPTLRTPKWSGSASYYHQFDLTDSSTLTPGVTVNFATSQFLDTNYTALMRQKGYATVDGSLTFDATSLKLSITGWIRNIANTRVMTGGVMLLPTYSRPTLLPPRTYGISLRKNF